ncbi:MAG: glycosyltransferase [Aeriscardovia sp.]|jgi:glycosyltransferase involved in cell wall biosynthesis|nr:glycosyltransferase [Aeriscardovia sp.]
MKILLIGEYSNVHATLARGFHQIGHEVTLVSNGDFWKNYPRDIDVSRQPGKWGGIKLMAKIYSLLPKLRGYDIVQVINPMFFELRAERIFPIYKYLKNSNKRFVLGAMGMDWYWVHTNTYRKPLRYSDFNIGDEVRKNADAVKERKDWIGTAKERLNKLIASESDAIVAGLYEYKVCYDMYFPEKTTFIPFPIELTKQINHDFKIPEKIKIFIGISKNRSEYKGTDIMMMAAEKIKDKYPNRIKLIKVEGVPFAKYEQLMNGSDLILDQLYSYTPSMNPLLAMSKGIICVGGGENENYQIINEKKLRPIINVQPNYNSVYEELEKIVLHPEIIPKLKSESIEYVKRHHDYIKVSKQYIDMYEKIL